MRKRLFEIIEVSKDNDVASLIYDWFMFITIIASIIPLFFVGKTNSLFTWIDRITVIIFIFDYMVRLFTADQKLNKGGASFILYPVTPMAIIDLLSILPSVTVLNGGLKLLKIFRLFRTFKIFRVFKVFRYSKTLQLFTNVLMREKDELITIFGVAFGFVVVLALIALNIEPETLGYSYFTALYWAVEAMSTIGFGEIYLVTRAGQILTMISAFIGIALVSLPAAVLVSGFQEELKSRIDDKKE